MKKQPIGQLFGRIPSTARIVTVTDVYDPETNPNGQLAVSADLSEKQDKLIAGENITIAEDGKTISATGGSNDGCVYDVVSVTDSALEIDSKKTVYKHAPTTDATYSFAMPAAGNGKVVFWLWITLGDTAPVLTFPSSVTWQSEPTFAANSETMLAFMSTDNGATWQANVQWEKAVTACLQRGLTR